MRYAIYFTPGPQTLLQRTAAGWLRRDLFAGTMTAPAPAGGLTEAEIAFHTASARRYGFHATLKAPFRLAAGESEASLMAALDDFAAAHDPVVIPRLVVGRIDGFFALVQQHCAADLQHFAGRVVADFDGFRAPLSDAEIERRNPDALSPAEFRNLCQWGYPYVFDTFRFHMTLTGRVAPDQASRVRRAVEEVFAAALETPVPVDALTLFVEPEAGAPFEVRSRHVFGEARERRSA